MKLLSNRIVVVHYPQHQRISLLAILASALGFRLLGISSRPIWYDEAFAVLFSEKGPAAMARGTLTVTGTAAADVHPLGYYTLLWLWMHVFGESLVAVRLLSILGGLAVVAAIFFLASSLFKPSTAVVAGILAALAPFQVHFAQEIRMYVFLCLWLLLATYSYWRLSHDAGWAWAIAFGVFAGLAQYTQNLAAFYLIALAAWPLIVRNWHAFKRVLLGAGIALLLYLPWLLHLPAQFAKVEQGYWVLKPDVFRLLALPVIYLMGLPAPNNLLAIGLFLGLGILSVGLFGTIRAMSQRSASLPRGLWLLYLAIVPPVLMFLASQWRPIYLERALLPSGAIFLVWLAWAAAEERSWNPPHLVLVALIVAAFGLGLWEHLTNTGGLYGPYQAITQDLEARWRPDDIVVHSNKYSMLPSVYFDRQLDQTYIGDVPGSAADTLAPATQETLQLLAQPDMQTAAGHASRVWFVAFEGISTDDPAFAWLAVHYSQVESRLWGGLRVYLFVRQP